LTGWVIVGLGWGNGIEVELGYVPSDWICLGTGMGWKHNRDPIVDTDIAYSGDGPG
jgi:hypothetical protein